MRAQAIIELKTKGEALVKRLHGQLQKLAGVSSKLNAARGSTAAASALRRQEVAARKLRLEYHRLSGAMTKVRSAGANLFKRGGVLLGGALALKASLAGIALPMFGTAVEFEKLNLMLRNAVINGDEAKAAMSWIMDMEGKTPFNLEEVTRAFISLRQMGIDPTGGAFVAAGDAAAATGKQVLDAVEAIKDAATGENERLKEFGVTSSTNSKTGKVTYRYTNKAGEQKEITANLRDQLDIVTKLSAILQDKYGGSMEDLASGWSGILSSITSMKQKFELMVMNGGPFERLKGALKSFLDQLSTWEKDGTMKRFADMIATNFVSVFERIAPLATGAASAIADVARIIDQLATAAGGYQNLGYFAISLLLVSKAMGLVVVGAQAAVILGKIAVLATGGAAAGLFAIAAGLAAVGAAAFAAEKYAQNKETGWTDWIEAKRPQMRDDRANPAVSDGNHQTAMARSSFRLGVMMRENISKAWGDLITIIGQKKADIINMVRDLGPQLVSAVSSGLGSLWEVGSRWMASLLDGIKAKVGEIISYVSGIGSQVNAALGGVVDGAPSRYLGPRGQLQGKTPATPAVPSSSAGGPRAMGGSVYKGGTHLVGERGPELLTAARTGFVTPNHKLGKGGGTTNINLGGLTINGKATAAEAQRFASLLMQKIRSGLHDGAYA